MNITQGNGKTKPEQSAINDGHFYVHQASVYFYLNIRASGHILLFSNQNMCCTEYLGHYSCYSGC